MGTPAIRHIKMTLEGEEFAHPNLRAHLYHREANTRHILRPVELSLWVAPRRETFGSIEGDWLAIGFDAPPVGQVNLALLDTGETCSMLVDEDTQQCYVTLQGRTYRAVYWNYVTPTPRWPWRIIQWHDRVALTQLLGETICIWPRRHDGYWDAILEPVQVASVHGNRQRYGIGLLQALESSADPLVPVSPGVWPLRKLCDVSQDNAKPRHLTLVNFLRPPLVLWAPREVQTPLVYTSQANGEQGGRTPTWTVDEGLNSEFEGFRLLLPDPAGTNPGIWDSGDMPNGSGWGPQPSVDVQKGAGEYCIECIRDGKPYVPVVNRTHSLCLQHYNRYRTELNGSFNRKGGPKALARKKPRLHFAGDEGVTTKTKRVPKTIGIRGVDDE